MYLNMLAERPLYKRFSLRHLPVNPDVYKSTEYTLVTGTRKRRRGHQTGREDETDHRAPDTHGQAELYCAGEATNMVQTALNSIFEDCVIHGMKLLRAGTGRQLFHRDFHPTAPDGCATLVWAWDGPRRVTFLQTDYTTSTVTPVVVDMNQGEALLIPASSIHAGGGGDSTNVCLFFYILRKPEENSMRRQRGQQWEVRMTQESHWPLVAEPGQVTLDDDPLKPAAAAGASSSSATARASSSSAASTSAAASSSSSLLDPTYAAYCQRLACQDANSPDKCPICMEEYQDEHATVALRVCKHKFHANCLHTALGTPWDDANVHPGSVYVLHSCPVCRKQITPAEARRVNSLMAQSTASLVLE